MTIWKNGICAQNKSNFEYELTRHSRQKRTNSIQTKKAFDSSEGKVVRVDDLKHQQNMSNAEHAIQDLQDILESYYKVARKRFVDNVCMQATGYYLLQGPLTPMGLLSSSLVSSLSREQLDQIAGEDRSVILLI
jgi:hypothetical protein